VENSHKLSKSTISINLEQSKQFSEIMTLLHYIVHNLDQSQYQSIITNYHISSVKEKKKHKIVSFP